MSPVAGVEILGPVSQDAKTILTNEAVEFLASLHRTFNATRKHLLKRRQLRQQQIDAGVLLDFLPETKHIRDDETWRAAIPAPGLEDRRVEITGPVDRKMVCFKDLKLLTIIGYQCSEQQRQDLHGRLRGYQPNFDRRALTFRLAMSRVHTDVDWTSEPS